MVSVAVQLIGVSCVPKSYNYEALNKKEIWFSGLAVWMIWSHKNIGVQWIDVEFVYVCQAHIYVRGDVMCCKIWIPMFIKLYDIFLT